MNARASRRALIVASVPELTKRTSSRLGIASRISRASSSSSGLGAPKLVPACGGRVERSDDPWMRVPEDQRPPGEDVVDVAVAVDVDQVRALAALDEERRAADGPKCANGRADAAGQQAEASAKSASDLVVLASRTA